MSGVNTMVLGLLWGDWLLGRGRRVRNNATEDARYAALSRRGSLGREIQRCDYYAETWRDRIVEAGGQVPNFEGYSALMLEHDSALSGIWLALLGKVRYANPESESKALYADVFVMLGSSDTAQTAHRTGTTAMAGPTYALVRSHGDTLRFSVMSYADPLTGLDNFRSYTDCIGRLHQDHQPYVLLSVDMNGFKLVNDTYGHEADDVVLRCVGGLIREAPRDEDRAFRVGGDEFAVVMTGAIAEGECERIQDRIDQAAAGDVTVGPDRQAAVSASVGFARYQGDDCPASEVRNQADVQMYGSKRRSRR